MSSLTLASKLHAVPWTPETSADFLARMPKVETHVHLDGTLSPATILRLAKAQSYAPLSAKTEEELRRLAVVSDPRESLAAVLKAFETFYPLLKTAHALELVARELLAAAARENVRYVEVRYAPALNAAPGFSERHSLEAVLKGLKAGEKATGVGWGVILCLFRGHDLKANEAVLDLAATFQSRGVAGVDLAGDEGRHPLKDAAELFRAAKSIGLATTVHAGEVSGSSDLELALELGIDRISHATLLAEKPALAAEIAKRGVSIETNLTSNVRTGAVRRLKDHPARGWFERGIRITPSTDDPGVFGITLTGEYALMKDELGFTVPELAQVTLQGIEALFLDAAGKKALRARFERELDWLLDSFKA